MDICVFRGPERSVWVRVTPPDPSVSLTAKEPAQWAFGRKDGPLDFFAVPPLFQNRFMFFSIYGLREPVLVRPDDPGFDTVCARVEDGFITQSPTEVVTAFICQYGLQLGLGLPVMVSISGATGKAYVLGGVVAYFPTQRQAMTAALSQHGFVF